MVEGFVGRAISPFTGLASGTWEQMRKSPLSEGYGGFFNIGAQLKLLLPVLIIGGIVLVIGTIAFPYYMSYKAITKGGKK